MAGVPEHEFLISGERAALGLLRRDQLPRLAAWFNDPDVRRGLAHRGIVNEDAETAWYERTTEAAGQPRPTEVPFAVHDAADGELVGVCGLENIDHERAGFRVIGTRRDSVRALGRRWDSVLMDATAEGFDSPVLGR